MGSNGSSWQTETHFTGFQGMLRLSFYLSRKILLFYPVSIQPELIPDNQLSCYQWFCHFGSLGKPNDNVVWHVTTASPKMLSEMSQ